MTPFLRISLFMALVVVAISSQAQENVGIGTKTPTNTLHISPITPGANDPLRVDGFMQYSNNDTTVLVVNPTSGVIRYIPFSTLGNILGGNSGTDNQNLDSARLIGNTLEIFIENGNSASVDLSSIGGGTDDQVLDSARLVGSTLEIYLENGGNTSVDLSSLAGADDQNLDSAKLVGNVLEIYIEDGNSTSVDLSAILGSDDQMIDSVKLNNSFLEIYLENGGLGAVDLSPISSSDDQVLDSARLVGSILEIYLENGGNANVDLSSLSGGSDDQNLDSAKLVGNILEIYIEDGNSTSVDLSSISSSNDNDWTLDGDTLYSAPDSAVVIKGGNVGIGTTDPNNALDIEFSLDGTLSSEVYNTSSHPDAVARMVVRSAGNRSWILGNYHTGYNGSFGSYFANKMMLTNAGDLSVNPDIAIYNRSTSGNIQFLTGGISGASDLRMIIKEDGNVGIGTALPDQKLHVTDITDPVKFNGIAIDNTLDTVLNIDAQGVIHKAHIDDLINSSDNDWHNTSSGTPTSINDDIHTLGNVSIGTTASSHQLRVVGGKVNIKNTATAAADVFTLSSYNQDAPAIVMGAPGGAPGFGRIALKMAASSQPDLIVLNANPFGDSYFNSGANLGVGTTSPATKLEVVGTITATAFSATTTGAGAYMYNTNQNMNVPDYVFEHYFDDNHINNPKYKMLNISRLEKYIKRNKHLPRVPSREQILKDGAVNLQALGMITLEKVEESHLYIIELEKKNQTLQQQLNQLEKKNNELEKRLLKLENTLK